MLKTIIHTFDPSEDAISLLKADHRKVEGLFKEFEDAKDKRSKLSVAKNICMELAIHDKLESKIFYPATKRVAGDAKDEINEGIVEHEAIRRLIREIPTLAASDEFFETRVQVLMEYVKHHVKEEEHTMFPKIVESDVDLGKLGARLAEAKPRYQKDYTVAPKVSRTPTAVPVKPAKSSKTAKKPRAEARAI